MQYIADFHLHSKFSRATSRDMDIEHIAEWAKIKGIDIVGTGDFTHPAWRKELKAALKPAEDGLYEHNGIRFILTAEVSNIYTQDGRCHRIHNVLFAPSIEIADKISEEFGRIGNIKSDGRPIFGFDCKKLCEIVFGADEHCMIVPAHAWTPWFSIFGSKSGFDSIEECFGEYTPKIRAIETGLSSDPAMNWRLSALDDIILISNSDAHSPSKLGREANIFELDKLDYKDIRRTISDKKYALKHFTRTVEFFPEEGKYHYDGHRDCGIYLSPEETKKHNGLCPKCKKLVTVGGMNRVALLADRKAGQKPKTTIPFTSMIPLIEIIAEAHGKKPAAKAVQAEYFKMIKDIGPEFKILLDMPIADIVAAGNAKIADGISRVREGKVKIRPGYDGEFGKISIFGEPAKQEKAQKVKINSVEGQVELFNNQ